MFISAAAKVSDLPPGLIEEVFGKIKLGSSQSFASAEDVDRWVAEQAGSGEMALRIAIAMDKVDHGRSVKVAEAWLGQREAERTDSRATAAVVAAERSAAASESSARWTFWAAIAAALGALATAVPAAIMLIK